MSRLLLNEIDFITYKFGGSHKGIDLIPQDRSLCYIIAHSDGVVIDCRNDYTKCDEKTGASYGNFVELDHGNGYHTVYAHMKAGTVTVKVGDKVKKGAKLGYMWNSGKSNGKHLHWEVKYNGVKIDPSLFRTKDFPIPVSKLPDSDFELALDVLDNKYGVGEERKKKLGDRYNDVQDIVTFIVEARNDTVQEIAEQILDGLWNNGTLRKRAIIHAGHDYDKVQEEVGRLLEERSKVYHDVVDGDTLVSLLAKYNISIEQLEEMNNLIQVGQKLRVK